MTHWPCKTCQTVQVWPNTACVLARARHFRLHTSATMTVTAMLCDTQDHAAACRPWVCCRIVTTAQVDMLLVVLLLTCISRCSHFCQEMTRCILTDLRDPLQYNFPQRCVLTGRLPCCRMLKTTGSLTFSAWQRKPRAAPCQCFQLILRAPLDLLMSLVWTSRSSSTTYARLNLGIRTTPTTTGKLRK